MTMSRWRWVDDGDVNVDGCVEHLLIFSHYQKGYQEFNIAPEKWWLEDYFPIGECNFSGAVLNFGRVTFWTWKSPLWQKEHHLSILHFLVPSSKLTNRHGKSPSLPDGPGGFSMAILLLCRNVSMWNFVSFFKMCLPSRELTYPTLGKGKSSSTCHFWGIC